MKINRWEEDKPIKTPSRERETFSWDEVDVYL